MIASFSEPNMINRFKNELTKRLKILVFLFRECHNQCRFCVLNNRFLVIPSSEEFLMTSPSTTANRLSLCIAENPTYIPKVSFMGGELFENREIAKHVYDTIVESSKLIA